MPRKARKVVLTPSEIRMDLGIWVAKNMTVIEQSGAEWTVVCPRCSLPKLAIHVDRKAWQCWRCHWVGWQPVDLVMAVLGCKLRPAMEEIASGLMTVDSGIVAPLEGPRTARGDLPPAPLPPGTVQGLEGIAERYARYRGIPQEHAQMFGLCSVRGDGSRSKADRLLSGRLLIPCWGKRGRWLVYWVARSTLGGKPKTINCPSSARHVEWGLEHIPECAGSSEVLVGLHLVQPGARVWLVEGPLDAVVCGPGFVSPLGAKLSRQQAKLIAGTGASDAVVLFDPDEPGVKGGRHAARLLSAYLPTQVAQCPPGEDPATLGRDRALALGDNTVADYIPPL